MKISQKIINFLEKEGIKYQTLEHKTVYTAFDKSATLKIDLKEIAKSIILKGDNLFFIVIISGNKNIDKEKFKKVLNVVRKKKREKLIKKIDFASEKWIKNYFKGTKIGSVPPFGKLYKLPVFIDKPLLKNKNIYFSSDNYNNSIIITPKEFIKTTENLFEGNFSVPKKIKKIKKVIKIKKVKKIINLKKKINKTKKKIIKSKS